MTPPAHVLIVGASAAGLSTLETLRRLGHTGTVTLLGDEPHPPYDRPPLSKQILAGAWTPQRAHLRPAAALDALDATFHLGDPAVALDPASRTVHTASGRRHQADAIVVATGATARTLPGQDTVAGVHVIRTLDDATGLRAELTPGRRLVVVGDGVLGCEVAATAAALGLDTTLVGPQQAPMRAQLGPRAADLLGLLHTANGVRLRLTTTVTGLAVDGARVRGVETTDGQVLPADVVLVAFGATPATGWLDGSGLTLVDGIVCDAYCRAAPGVWAVGDVARFHHEGLGRDVRLENRTNATEQAAAVAADILGAGRPYTPVPYFWTDQFDVKIQVHGIPGPGMHTEVTDGDPTAGRFVLTYHLDGRPAAVLGWNMPKQARRQRQSLLTAMTTAPV
ncbi:FAD-dependent oxidoreductase [Actinoplanes sp. NPDC051851]|uniref:NAD(P)/FAD-dependent oxidoreductase n=1 Tax=Actinoplanes sp. NPDC051851 TaxID=3154753 RepID=UPI003431ADA1